jgi:lysophospholipase L1-like esterase
VLFVGDSITQGWNGAKETWDKEFGAWKPGNLGIGGDQTQHVLWRITEGAEIEKIDPKVIVLMIGTNNTGGHTAEQIAGGVKAILDVLAAKKPKAKVLLLGVFPRAGKKPGADATEVKAADLHPKIAAINDLISKFDNGKSVHYLDIGKVFLDESGNMPKKLMPDYLHLSKDGYVKWAAAIKEPVEKLLK